MGRRPTRIKLTDAEGKAALRTWPTATTALFEGTEQQPWLQAQPKAEGRHASTPCLLVAGAYAMTTRPDGLWIRVEGPNGVADVFCVEVCGSLQNFQDKRSRYCATIGSKILRCSPDWWGERIYVNQTRWQKSGQFDSAPTADTFFPIRHVRVLYALAPDPYRIFSQSGVAEAHEYFIEHRHLTQFNSQSMQEFLRRMAPKNHLIS